MLSRFVCVALLAFLSVGSLELEQRRVSEAATTDPPTLTLAVTPRSPNLGDDVTVTWASAHATACKASGAWSGSKPLSGRRVIGPMKLTMRAFSLRCTGPAGAITKSVSVTVVDTTPPTLTLTVTPSQIDAGEFATLSWSSEHTTACTAFGGWSGGKPLKGKRLLEALVATKSFGLACTGKGGTVKRSVRVTVAGDGLPTVSIDEPRGGPVSGVVQLTARAAADGGPVTVQFTLDDRDIGPTLTDSPFGMTWDSTTVSDGQHTLIAVARDADGNETESDPVRITVSNEPTEIPPTVAGPHYLLEITKPRDAPFTRYKRLTRFYRLSGRETVEAWLFTPGGGPMPCYPDFPKCPHIELSPWPTVWFTIDGARVGTAMTSPPYTMTLDTRAFEDGSHILGLDVISRDGSDIRVVPIPITIDNVPGPVTGPQPLAICATRFDYVFDLAGPGCDWVVYPGAPLRLSGFPHTFPHLAVPFDTMPPARELWAQRMTTAGQGFHWRYFEAPGGHITISPKQQYFYRQINDHKLPLIDGPRNVAALGQVVAGVVHPRTGELYATVVHGQIARVSLTGEVSTVIGYRVKPGKLPPYWDSDNREFMAEDGADFFESRYEVVGNFVDGPKYLFEPWDTVFDPRDPTWNTLYVTDTLNHRIVKVNLSTTPPTVSTYAGSLSAQWGYADGVGTSARFYKPWSIAIDGAGNLYVSDMENNAIRKITPDRRVTTVVRSAVHPDEEVLEKTRYTELRSRYQRDGAFGTATLIFPQGMQFDSRGRLIVAEKFLKTIRRIDIDAGRIDTFAPFPKSQTNHLDTQVFVDTAGECGPKDDVLLATWAQGGPWRVSADGNQGGPLLNRDPPDVDLHEGRANRLTDFGYPWMVTCSKGALWIGGIRDGLYRLTKARPTDPDMSKEEGFRYLAGRRVYHMGSVPGFPPRPSFSLVHGNNGVNQLGGEPTFDQLAGVDDATLGLDIRRGWGSTAGARPEITGRDLDNLIYYVRWNCLPCLMSGMAIPRPRPADVTPPTITGVSVEPRPSGGAVVRWRTSEPTIGFVAFGAKNTYGNVSEVEPGFDTEHAVVIDGLPAGTTYHFAVRARDVAGNQSVTGDLTFTLP
jgi:sugar lactone lactonase YvrE